MWNYGLHRTDKWYEHKPGGKVENDKVKILWDFMVQWDHEIEHRNLNILVVDVAFPAYRKVSDKEWKKKKGRKK